MLEQRNEGTTLISLYLIEKIDNINNLVDRYHFKDARFFCPLSEVDEEKVNILVEIVEGYEDKISLYEKGRLQKEIESILGCDVVILVATMLDKTYLNAIMPQSVKINKDYSNSLSNLIQSYPALNAKLLKEAQSSIQESALPVMVVDENESTLLVTIKLPKNATSSKNGYTQQIINYLQGNPIEDQLAKLSLIV